MMDRLDQKLTSVYSGKVVRKDLLHRIKKGTNVPTFVLEFLLARYCASEEEAEILEEEFILQNRLANLEIIDVSYGQEVRGFNIFGHHYWYRHPWMSSDIVFLMRTDLPAHRRGLAPTELEGIWYLSPDYPEKIREAAAKEMVGQW